MDLDSLKLLNLEIQIMLWQIKRDFHSLGFKEEDDKKAIVTVDDRDNSDSVVISGGEDRHKLIVVKEEVENGVVCKPEKPNYLVTQLRNSDMMVLQDVIVDSNTSSKSIGYQLENQVDVTSEKMTTRRELNVQSVTEVDLKSRIENNFQQIATVSKNNSHCQTLRNQLLIPKTPSYVMKSAIVSYAISCDRLINLCSKNGVFGYAHQVLDESHEPKCVGKSVYANIYGVSFDFWDHKPPKPPDYTNFHPSRKYFHISNVTRLTFPAPIPQSTFAILPLVTPNSFNYFVTTHKKLPMTQPLRKPHTKPIKANVDTTCDVTELCWFQMVAGLPGMTYDLQNEVRNCAPEILFELHNKRGSHFSKKVGKDFKLSLFVELRLIVSMMMHKFLTNAPSIKHYSQVKLMKCGSRMKYVAMFFIMGAEGGFILLTMYADEFWFDKTCSEKLQEMFLNDSKELLFSLDLFGGLDAYNKMGSYSLMSIVGTLRGKDLSRLDVAEIICNLIKKFLPKCGGALMISMGSNISAMMLKCCVSYVTPTILKINIIDVTLWVNPLNTVTSGLSCGFRLLLEGLAILLIECEHKNCPYPLAVMVVKLIILFWEEGTEIDFLLVLVIILNQYLRVNYEYWRYKDKHSCWKVTLKVLAFLKICILLILHSPKLRGTVCDYRHICIGKMVLTNYAGSFDKRKAENDLAYHIIEHVVVVVSFPYEFYLEHFVMVHGDWVYSVEWQPLFLVQDLNGTTDISGNEGFHMLKTVPDAVPSVLTEPPRGEQLTGHTLWPGSHKLSGQGNELFLLCGYHHCNLMALHCKIKSASVMGIGLWKADTCGLRDHKIITELPPTTEKGGFNAMSLLIFMVHVSNMAIIEVLVQWFKSVVD